MAEQADVRWKRLVESRLPKFREALHMITFLSNATRYDYDEEDVRYWFGTLRSRIDMVKQEYLKPKGKRSLLKFDIIPMPNIRSRGKKHDYFHNIMYKRMQEPVRVLNLLLNQTNRSRYQWSSYDAKQVFQWMEKSLEVVEANFLGIPEFHFQRMEDLDRPRNGGED